jgi:hypothetical protein
MKRFFCDHCGTEFRYDDKAVKQTNDAEFTFTLTKPGKQPIVATVRLSLKPQYHVMAVDPSPNRFHRGSSQPEAMLVRKDHADLCGTCRWAIIDQLRAGLPLTSPATIPGAIDWNKAGAITSTDTRFPDD